VAQPDKRHENRAASLLEWYDRHKAYSTTSSSNEKEEEENKQTQKNLPTKAFLVFVNQDLEVLNNIIF